MDTVQRCWVFFGVALKQAFDKHAYAKSHDEISHLSNHIHTEKVLDGAATQVHALFFSSNDIIISPVSHVTR